MQRGNEVMKKLMIGCGSIFVAFLLLGACVAIISDGEDTTEKPATSAKSEEVVKSPPFEEYVKNIHGNTFMKDGTLKDGVVTIRYYSDYQEYKKANPKSNVDAQTFSTYWSGSQNTQKRLEINLTKGFTESLRLVRLYPEIKKVDIEIPVRSYTYKFEATTEEIEQFFNADLDALRKAYQKGNASLSEYIDPVILKDSKRKEFLDTFVTKTG